MAYWTVAQTHPLCERKAERFLKVLGVESYVPLVCSFQRKGGQVQKRVSALFARYIFVSVQDRWHHIANSIGISNILVGQDLAPKKVADHLVSNIRSMENSDGLIVLPKKEPFKRGQRVRIISGSFAGQLALYDYMTPEECACVLVSMLGQWCPVQLKIGDRIEAVT